MEWDFKWDGHYSDVMVLIPPPFLHTFPSVPNTQHEDSDPSLRVTVWFLSVCLDLQSVQEIENLELQNPLEPKQNNIDIQTVYWIRFSSRQCAADWDSQRLGFGPAMCWRSCSDTSRSCSGVQKTSVFWGGENMAHFQRLEAEVHSLWKLFCTGRSWDFGDPRLSELQSSDRRRPGFQDCCSEYRRPADRRPADGCRLHDAAETETSLRSWKKPQL